MGQESEKSMYIILPKKEAVIGATGSWKLVKPIIAEYDELIVPGGNFMRLGFQPQNILVGGGMAEDLDSITRATTRLVVLMVSAYESYLAVKNNPHCSRNVKELGEQIGQYLILCGFDAAGKS